MIDNNKLLERGLDSIEKLNISIDKLNIKVSKIDDKVNNLRAEVIKIGTRIDIIWAISGIIVVLASIGTFILTIVKG